ncbi:methyl-accepting chemotaxis protein [Acidimangrovimonas sediminis]|uniref:methyl-accepting chemotaxis protein n=1 Tax=Acidimangrovimonas sediminis TaxID=2056283 RepID=UPI000C7FD07F|nr:methyl-accepting chemotaxis protein [Acidimangrovimonas sediminis]
MLFRSRAATAPAPEAARLRAIEEELAVVVFRPDGTILSTSPSYAGMLGHGPGMLDGTQLQALIAPEARGAFGTGAAWQALARGETARETLPHQGRSGARLWLDLTQVPVRAADGSLSQILAVATDVTRGTEEAARSRAMVDAVRRSNAVIDFSPEGIVLDANPLFLKVTGYTIDEIRGQHHRIFMPPGTAEGAAYRAFWDGLRRGEFHEGEFRRIGKTGQEIWLQATYNPIFDTNGNLVSIAKLAIDITASRATARDAAAQIEALGRSQAVIEFALDGRVLRANDNFCTTMGCDRTSVIGRHHSEFVCPEDRDGPDYAALWSDLRSGRFREGEFRRMARGGREVWIQATYNPILGEDGQPVKVVKFAMDVTARKRAVLDFLHAVEALREGDLTSRITTPMPGEMEALRTNFNAALEGMTALVGAIQGNVDMTLSETESLTRAATDLGTRAERQAASLEETAAAIAELTETVGGSSRGAANAATVVGTARSRSGEGREVVAQTIGAMNDIAEGSKKISRITDVIEDIAFQTNLLALNAGVEAARAGETGRGFAVVASEVRALAQRSADAAGEISELIATSDRQVQQGVSLVARTGDMLGEIDRLVSDVDGLVREIAVAAQKQSLGLTEINGAVDQLDRLTQQNAAMFEETSAAISALRQQAATLAEQAARFRTSARAEDLRRAS